MSLNIEIGNREKLQLMKANAKRQTTFKSRNHFHQFENTCAANTHNMLQKDITQHITAKLCK